MKKPDQNMMEVVDGIHYESNFQIDKSLSKISKDIKRAEKNGCSPVSLGGLHAERCYLDEQESEYKKKLNSE